ncbi:hypothetical protein UCRNP2_9987 [Neofusicoccum parvum UCRNP2]|uniref:Uncharacterized protein n=2 Tax=Neofusicoccum parvum TaxID=310453 RepID=R1E7B0_BOTPV|nr:hypothetical protein UCRNP2_9987 [Neofusicoccum parvum UCRNP2]GME26511.1 hypothetical protein GTA08_BOTSDO10091 [Neofusicoccum parvum]
MSSKSGASATSSDAASVMSASSTRSTSSLLKKVFQRDHSAKPMTDAELAKADQIRQDKAAYATAAATYMSLR